MFEDVDDAGVEESEAPEVTLDDEGCDPLARYLAEISRYPLLSRSEEAALGQRLRAGDMKARDKLVAHNQRLILSVVRKYRGDRSKLPDLIQAANLKLTELSGEFDERRGSFANFVLEPIEFAIQDECARIDEPIELTAYARQIARRIKKDRSWRKKGVEALARKSALSPTCVKTAIHAASFTFVSLSDTKDGVTSKRWSEVIADRTFLAPEHMLMAQEALAEARARLLLLKTRARAIIVAAVKDRKAGERNADLFERYALTSRPERPRSARKDLPPTTHELGKAFGISHELARQIIQSILKQPSIPRREEFRSFADRIEELETLVASVN